MKLLAIDTSSLACTVGVALDDHVFVRHEEQPREHTRILMPMIRSALGEAGTDTSALDAVVLGNGPGSFIGMRIAASVAQGIAYAAGIPVVPVSSLAVVATAAGRPGDIVAVTQDAHMNEVYLGLYRIDDAGIAVAEGPECLHAQQRIEALLDYDDGVVAAGHGWQRYPDLEAANREWIASVSEVLYPHAAALSKLGSRAFEAGATIAAEAVNPAYLRQKVASKPGT